MPRTPRPDTAARRKLETLSFITTKLDALSADSLDSVLRVLSWTRTTNAIAVSAIDRELDVLVAIARRLHRIDDAGERISILRWLDEHYLADDRTPEGGFETVNLPTLSSFDAAEPPEL